VPSNAGDECAEATPQPPNVTANRVNVVAADAFGDSNRWQRHDFKIPSWCEYRLRPGRAEHLFAWYELDVHVGYPADGMRMASAASEPPPANLVFLNKFPSTTWRELTNVPERRINPRPPGGSVNPVGKSAFDYVRPRFQSPRLHMNWNSEDAELWKTLGPSAS